MKYINCNHRYPILLTNEQSWAVVTTSEAMRSTVGICTHCRERVHHIVEDSETRALTIKEQQDIQIYRYTEGQME